MGFRAIGPILGMGPDSENCRSTHLRLRIPGSSLELLDPLKTIPIVSIVVPFFWFNQLYIKDFIRYPPEGTRMETFGNPETLPWTPSSM